MEYQKCEKCKHYHEELEECNATAKPAWEVPEDECEFLSIDWVNR